MKSGNLNFLEPSGPLQACNGTALAFTFYDKSIRLSKENSGKWPAFEFLVGINIMATPSFEEASN